MLVPSRVQVRPAQTQCQVNTINTGRLRLGRRTHQIILFHHDEKLLQSGTTSADVRDGVDTHTHTMHRESRQAMSLGGHDCFAEVVAQPMPNVSPNCGNVEPLKRRVGKEVKYVLLPLR